MRTLALRVLFVAGALVVGIPTSAQAPSETETDAAIARCLDEGGTWQSSTMLTASCVRPTTDAGRACTDKAQCQGLCVPGADAYDETGCSNERGVSVCSNRRRLLARAGDTLQGVCAATRRDVQPTNCGAHIVDGRLVIEGCAD